MSSALDAASLVMIPSGYEDGTLGSLKPTDGTGDFTFTRGSNISATRINADGNIEKGYENLYCCRVIQFDTSPWSIKRHKHNEWAKSGTMSSNDAWLLNEADGYRNLSKSTTKCINKRSSMCLVYMLKPQRMALCIY